ncbi:MAG: extracellular solute-binding protein [Alphaproteobacteria bacterium]|nr:extracellular solute-binding protein [Alphaproteobacteria bacterium]
MNSKPIAEFMTRVLTGAGMAAVLIGAAAAGAVADTPASAKELAAHYKIPAELMARWEAEHRVPAAWIAAARKEGEVVIKGSTRPLDFERSIAPFRTRYPYIKVNYSRGSRNTRVVAPLVAFREGRHITDIVTGIDTAIDMFKKADALTDLTDLPNRDNIPDKFAGRSTHWAGIRLRYYCLAYNTNQVKKSQLPKTWDDLKNSTVLHNNKMALWYGVASWLLPLWGEKGPQWTTRFITDIYETVKAERRKEGMTALTSLTAAGEFNAVLAVAAYQVVRLQKKGAPVAFHCPDAVMVTSSSVGILKGNPHTNAAKLYLNWLLSMEGQLFQYRHTGAPPIHKALQRKEFVPFPEETLGKTLAFRDPKLLGEELTALFKVWKPYWESGEGPKGEGRKRKGRGKRKSR